MFNKNPAVVLGALAEMIKAAVPALILFNIIHWTPDQVAAVMFVVSIGVTSITTILTRAQVTPNEQVDTLIKTATHFDPDTDPQIVKDAQAAKDAK